MTVLAWRPQTRAQLLREMNCGASLGIAVANAPAVGPGDPTGQHLEDLRLGVPLDEAPRLDAIHPYRRRFDSTVYHSHGLCPAWPLEAPYLEQLGLPPIGLSCRECAALWGQR